MRTAILYPSLWLQMLPQWLENFCICGGEHVNAVLGKFRLMATLFLLNAIITINISDFTTYLSDALPVFSLFAGSSPTIPDFSYSFPSRINMDIHNYKYFPVSVQVLLCNVASLFLHQKTAHSLKFVQKMTNIEQQKRNKPRNSKRTRRYSVPAVFLLTHTKTIPLCC
jgi:hypothetical protein